MGTHFPQRLPTGFTSGGPITGGALRQRRRKKSCAVFLLRTRFSIFFKKGDLLALEEESLIKARTDREQHQPDSLEQPAHIRVPKSLHAAGVVQATAGESVRLRQRCGAWASGQPQLRQGIEQFEGIKAESGCEFIGREPISHATRLPGASDTKSNNISSQPFDHPRGLPTSSRKPSHCAGIRHLEQRLRTAHRHRGWSRPAIPTTPSSTIPTHTRLLSVHPTRLHLQIDHPHSHTAPPSPPPGSLPPLPIPIHESDRSLTPPTPIRPVRFSLASLINYW